MCGDSDVDVTLDRDHTGSWGGEVALIIYSVAANCPAYSFCFFFLGAIGANNADVSCLFVFGFGMVGNEEYGIGSMWNLYFHPLY